MFLINSLRKFKLLFTPKPRPKFDIVVVFSENSDCGLLTLKLKNNEIATSHIIRPKIGWQHSVLGFSFVMPKRLTFRLQKPAIQYDSHDCVSFVGGQHSRLQSETIGG
jgi:hypothetical protein